MQQHYASTQLFRIGMDYFYEIIVHSSRRISIQEQTQAVERRDMYILAHRVVYVNLKNEYRTLNRPARPWALVQKSKRI